MMMKSVVQHSEFVGARVRDTLHACNVCQVPDTKPITARSIKDLTYNFASPEDDLSAEMSAECF